MNFDFENLVLVNPCPLDDECYSRSMHANKILDDAQIFQTFNDAVKDIDYLVATSSIDSQNDKRHLRNAVYIDDFAGRISEIEGKIGLVFGREDFGLLNEEIAKCDIMIKIPTSDSYKSLNLSHAVSLALYVLYIKMNFSPKLKRDIGKIEKEKLYEFFSNLLLEINYPKHKIEKTEVMFKRMMGRAMPSKWEYHSLMGVFSKTVEKLRKK